MTSQPTADTQGFPAGAGAAASAPPAKTYFMHEPTTGSIDRCLNCRISIRVIDSPPPMVCPFCQARLQRGTFQAGAPTPEPEGVYDENLAEERYHPTSKTVSFLLTFFLVLLLSIAIYLKLHNINYYWYQPLVNLYSLTVGVFILSRFILAAFYMAPRDVGYEPSVAVVVACRNEEGSIEKTIGRIYAEGYPHAKLEVVAVNDGSTDHTLEEMIRAQARHPALVVVDFEENKGKRHGMALGALLARGEVLVYVDSDSFLMPGAIHKIVQGLADPTVAAVAGHTDVENIRVNVLTKMQDVRYFVSYRIMKAAESLFGAVSCCPGCFSAYRKACVLHILDKWLHQKFLGHYATYGDDRALTNLLLRHYRILYDDEALATTIVPDRWKKYIIQQCRWKRSWVREMLLAGRFIWRKHPIAALSWYAMAILPMIAPLIMFHALILAPATQHQAPTFYIGGVLVVTLLWALYYLEKTGRSHWWSAFLFVLTYIGFFSWQGYYAMFTVRRTTWGTR